MRRPSLGAAFGLGGLPADTQRGLLVALSTSVASVMGVNLVYPVLPPMMQQLGVDQSAVGLVITVYTVPMIFVAPVAGAMADLHGRRAVLFGGMLLFGLAGAGALMPLTIVLLSDLLEGERETSGASRWSSTVSPRQ